VEYWDISSELIWYKYNYAEFMKAFRAEQYDLAVIGNCLSINLKLRDKPKNHPVVCYQPTVYLNLKNRVKSMASVNDLPAIFSAIKKQSTDVEPLCKEGGAFSGYNNRLMINSQHVVFKPVWNEGNIVFCDGWVPPQQLIREKFLEVN
jgi:hypothetical protein